MSKLYFRYGSMGCGKTMQLLQVAFNYEERGQKVAVMKPAIDVKAGNKIITRIGPSRPTDHLITAHENLYRLIANRHPDINCLLIDEAQFLSKSQINHLQRITIHLNIPVIAYGLRCDSKNEAWPGSRRLLEIADKIEEIKTICECGNKATMNCRFLDGTLQTTGPKILIDDNTTQIIYRSLCPKCYFALKKSSAPPPN
jgi:thymidine kinase